MAKRKSATDIACGVAEVEGDALGATLHAEKSAQRRCFVEKCGISVRFGACRAPEQAK